MRMEEGRSLMIIFTNYCISHMMSYNEPYNCRETIQRLLCYLYSYCWHQWYCVECWIGYRKIKRINFHMYSNNTQICHRLQHEIYLSQDTNLPSSNNRESKEQCIAGKCRLFELSAYIIPHPDIHNLQAGTMKKNPCALENILTKGRLEIDTVRVRWHKITFKLVSFEFWQKKAYDYYNL